MDTRIALKNKTELRFYNSSKGVCLYTIKEEIARGASCIVYDASYINNSGIKKLVRIKECYPFSLTIKRYEGGILLPIQSDRYGFEESKEKMRRSFDLGNELFGTSGLTNFTSNTLDIYELNNTVYVITTYQEGNTLSDSNFLTFKECIVVVKSTAKVISKIHQKGYLYLDIKPGNIFLLTGTTELVQLFDFDSLIPINAFMNNNLYNCEYKISYTKGFSALELQMGDQNKIGKYTDVYAIGALLFYLIFGTIPMAPDCGMDAEYDYEKSKYAMKTFQNKMYFELTDFFHHTLANFYLDRYQDMHQVIMKLEEIEKLSDTITPYILNSYIACSKVLIGREKEMEALNQWMNDANTNILFVTGIGGIGKSSIVQNYFINNIQRFDTIIYLKFHHSLKQTIADDQQFVINAVVQNEQETLDEYYMRKLRIAHKLTFHKNVVLIIDDFIFNDITEFNELLKLHWKMIVITRNNVIDSKFDCISIGPIQEQKNLYLMFEYYIRRPLEIDEYPMIDFIIDYVQGHTLVLELIAKQIANSFLSIIEAKKLIEEHGVFNIASEKVSYLKDCTFYTDTIKNIIDMLFLSSDITENKKTVLKAISFFGINGIDVHIFSNLYGMETKDVINELITNGWIRVENHMMIMHPVIIETARSWEITEEFKKTSIYMMNELKKQLKLDKKQYLSLSENFLECAKVEKELKNQQVYRELFFITLVCMPRYREDYILSNAIELTNNLGCLNKDLVIKLYDMIVEIYEEKHNLDMAYEYIMKAKQAIHKFKDNHIKGQYYYLLVGYFDYKLDGNYSTMNKEDRMLHYQLMKSLNKAIKYMKKSCHLDGKIELAEYLRCKANILIRSNFKSKIQIKRLLKKVDIIIKNEGQEFNELGSRYDLTCAWYYTYIEWNKDMVLYYIQQAYEVESKLYENDLDFIDNIVIASANILFECNQEKNAEDWLRFGIRLCEENGEVIPFIRKRIELYTYLLDIYNYIGNDEKIVETEKIIKKYYEKYKDSI